MDKVIRKSVEGGPGRRDRGDYAREFWGGVWWVPRVTGHCLRFFRLIEFKNDNRITFV